MNCCYNAEMFLHGTCHVFAYALHQEFGYDFLELKGKSGMIHWCCIADYNGTEIYIDVSGITADFNELIIEFQPDMGRSPSRKKL